MHDVIAIHGAWSSSNSFNHLRSRIDTGWNLCDYDHNRDNVDDIISKAWDQISQPCVVLGHSLGGMCALALHDHPLVERIITMASPLQGIDLNLVQRFLSRSRILPQIATDSKLVSDNKKRIYTKPVLHLIAGQGFNPYIYEDSDGVVPIRAQTGWTCGEVATISANHYEILQHDDTVTAIRAAIKKSR